MRGRRSGSVIRRLAAIAALVATVLIMTVAGQASITAGNIAGDIKPLVVAYPSKIDTLNPDIAVSYAGTSALHMIGGNLFELRGNNVVPGLAQSATVSANQLTWTFTLRKGLRFSNGLPLTSRDVAATYAHALHDKANTYVALLAPIKSLVTPNARTVVVNLKQPYASLKTVLASFQMTVFPSSLVNTSNFFDNPVSAGPFVLKSWGGTNTAVFGRNARYWGSKPKVPQVTFVTVADSSSALAQVEAGQIGLALGLPPSLLSQVRSPAKGYATPLYGAEVMTMRDTNAPLDNGNVRRAISKALDRAKMSQVVWAGKAKPLAAFWPSSLPGYDPSISTARDVKAAKALLSGTPCASGCTLSLKYSSAGYPEQGPEALVIKSSLADIGITLNLVDLDPGSYYNLFGGAYDFQLLLYPAYTSAKLPDHLASNALVYDAGQQAGYTGLKVPPIEAAVNKMAISSGTPRLVAARAINRLFVQYTPYTSLTEIGFVWVSRLPQSEVSVASTTFLDFAH